MSWCVVRGSPAQANPNIQGLGPLDPFSSLTPPGNDLRPGTPRPPADTNTDDIIWRRHERPPAYIYTRQAQITLRSGIHDAVHSALDFPLLNDPDTANGTPGDVNGWNVNVDRVEFITLINNCDAAYANLGRAGIGITAVNVGLFHDNADPRADVDGNRQPDGDTRLDYVGTIGWGAAMSFLSVPVLRLSTAV